MQRITAQLERLEAPAEDQGKSLTVTLEEFARGRGLNLALALGGFTITWLTLTTLSRLLGRLDRGRRTTASHLTRAAALVFRILTLVLGLFAAATILYSRGDWLLLTLLILLVLSLALGLRQSLPRHVEEIRLLLNLGGVREGESLIYAGIPWEIATINFFTTLRNPWLSGGELRLPLDRLIEQQSRPYDPQEPWFPSREGDFVFLEGEVFAKVLLQTPDVVQLQVVGATTSFPTATYLAKNPRNLSRDGFALPLTLGLDYRHQGEILTTIKPSLRAELEEALASQPFHEHLTTLLVEYNETASSTLNLLIVAVFAGPVAGDYWTIRRFLQRTLLEACNRHGWNIPFEQMTVHLQSLTRDFGFLGPPMAKDG